MPDFRQVAAVLTIFGALNLLAALGYELRLPTVELRPSSALLVGANALIIGGIGYGYGVLGEGAGPRAPGLWLGWVALLHLAAGLGALSSRRVNRGIGFLLLGTALTAGNLAFGLLVDGPALAVGWALSALALAALARLRGFDRGLASTTLASQLTLAICHTLMFDAPLTALGGGSVSFAPLVAIVLSAFGCARLTRAENDRWRVAADATALITLAYTTALGLNGLALVVAWAGQAVALLPVARRTGDSLAVGGVFGFLGAAVAHVLVFEAPPVALVTGVESFPAAAFALAVVGGATVALARVRLGAPGVPFRMLWLAAGLVPGYLASIGIIDVFQPAGGDAENAFGLGVRQQGQALLSAFWSLLGLALLRVGLRRGDRLVRQSAFGLLAVAVVKVFVFDMSALHSGYRILSFLVLGLLLLAGAYAYQRARQRGATERLQSPRTL